MFAVGPETKMEIPAYYFRWMAFPFRLGSDFYYFVSAVLLGGFMNGVFAALVEEVARKKHLLLLLATLLVVWGLAFFGVAQCIDDYERRSRGVVPSVAEQIQIQNFKWALCSVGAAFLVTLALYMVYR
jgi:bacteriorhodopsin